MWLIWSCWWDQASSGQMREWCCLKCCASAFRKGQFLKHWLINEINNLWLCDNMNTAVKCGPYVWLVSTLSFKNTNMVNPLEKAQKLLTPSEKEVKDRNKNKNKKKKKTKKKKNTSKQSNRKCGEYLEQEYVIHCVFFWLDQALSGQMC